MTSTWQRRAYSIEAMRLMAERALPKPVFHFADGGAEDEHTLKRNEAAFREIELLPRPLSGAAERDLSLTLFGKRLSLAACLDGGGQMTGMPDLVQRLQIETFRTM